MTSRQLRRAAERQALKQARQPAVGPPATPRSRAEINRANAAHSTGPNTAAGKANSSRNSFKHGLYSAQIATQNEHAAELDALKSDLRAQNQPINDAEEILINEMAEQFWRIKRARLFEANVLDGPELKFDFLAATQRLMTSAERGFHRSLTTLRQLQKNRGFVPQNCATQTECDEAQLEDTAQAQGTARVSLSTDLMHVNSAVNPGASSESIAPKIISVSG